VSTVRTSRYQRFLKRLQSARHEAGLTQTQVAKVFGRPQSFVSKCESGERRIDVFELEDFASIYGKPLTFFVAEGEDEGLGGASVAAEGPSRAGGSRRGRPRKPRPPKAAGARRRRR
jgi:transcriptional regulator with XRE-family HTH domain